ncbi:hypothetical protein BDV19DRAFT_379165 [Aspergillus venezuelensis]
MEHIISALEPGRGFLGHLAPSIIPHYPYRGSEQFLQDFEREFNPDKQTDHWFLLTGVTQQTFNKWFSKPESGPFSRGCAFDAALEQLLVALPESTTHSAAALAFNKMVGRAARTVRMEDGLKEIGSGKHTSQGMGTKQPDMAWRPARIIAGRNNNWPNVRYWLLAPPAGEVEIVLTLKINQRKKEMVIEKWENTCAQGGPHLEQKVTISRLRANNTIVTGSPLTISFSKLFLRHPLTTEEVDLQLDNQKLQFIAEMIWEEQWLNSQ